MTTVSILAKRAAHAFKSNSPVILTTTAIVGVGATAYLAAKAGREHERTHPPEVLKMPWRDEVKLVWKIYIPPAIAATATIASMLGARKIDAQRAAAITAAYSISEKAFSEYKSKVIEKIGETKEQQVRDEIVQERVANARPTNIIATAGGTVLCYELYTGRYFQSDMETLRKAQNEVNSKINREGYATLSDLYYILGLRQTSVSSDLGWQGRLMEMEFSTVLSEGDVPCLAFSYNYVGPVD